METIQQDIEYKGYIISLVWAYANGKCDFVFRKKYSDYGTIYPEVTIDEVKEWIDGLINE